MIREHTACIFASSPIADCGRDMRLPEPVLASHWPLAFIGIVFACWVGWVFVCHVLWPAEIDWEQEIVKKPLRHPEDIARDAGA